jgi:hypothetical protein
LHRDQVRELTTAEALTARPRLRRLTASILVLLIVMLPVLLAFVRIEAAPRDAEIARVEQAVLAEKAMQSKPILMFYGSMVSEDAPGRWEERKKDITVNARIAGMLALFGISALLYVLLFLVRGRATAALGCLTLCLLPPIAQEGFVLRAEQCSTLFGILGIVLIAGLPLMLQERARGVSPWLARASLMLVVGMTFGIARSCQVGAWIYLTVPAGALLLSVMTLVLMFPRAARGRSLMYWPFRAAARRYVPWMFLVLSSFALTLLVMQQGGGTVVDSQSDVGLLPESWWLAGPILIFAVLGAMRMGLGVGLRLGRLRRVRPDAVMFLYVAGLMMQHYLMPDGIDRMPAAVALACLVGDGAMSAAVVGFGQIAKKRTTAR